jgi:3-methylcrotonyl-CoA carboxylase alpha subunit
MGSVLIANRGEIAVRIARSCRKLGLKSVAVFSDADAGALHVEAADGAERIGPAHPRESYLNIPALIAAAGRSGVRYVHPGYGFLSENAEFAEACRKAGLVFVGPSPEVILAMGGKAVARLIAERAGVPCLPGDPGTDQSEEALAEAAARLGYPVMIKAIGGGGGRGMRRVRTPEEFPAALAAARREAQIFGDERVMLEKLVENARHIEVQILADGHGNVLHLHERDCTLQRRHQKLIEECPAPGMSAELRAELGRRACAIARSVNYVGAGTVEFIAAPPLRAESIWFMEMNTRLQVEHPVTEMVTGLDLVEWQLRIAAGERLPFAQSEIELNGHAVEARLCAEDPAKQFFPSPGKLAWLELPGEGQGVRVDAGVRSGDTITPYYDSMLAKVIAHAPTRELALEKLADALGVCRAEGVKLNAGFLAAALRSAEMREARMDTGFLEAARKTLLEAIVKEPA